MSKILPPPISEDKVDYRFQGKNGEGELKQIKKEYGGGVYFASDDSPAILRSIINADGTTSLRWEKVAQFNPPAPTQKTAQPKDEVAKAQASVVSDVNSTLTPEREQELIDRLKVGDDVQLQLQTLTQTTIPEKQGELEDERYFRGIDTPRFKTLQNEYNELLELREKLQRESLKPKQPQTEKITEEKEQQIEQTIESSKAKEDQRLAQEDQARQAAASSGVATQDVPQEKCPCGSTLTDAERSTINWGRSNPVFQNPVASQINNAQGGFADTLGKINRINGVLGALGGSTDQLNRLTNSVGNMQGILSDYQNTSNRLSGLPYTGDGPDLLSLVSTVGAAVNFQCALGVEGLDVGLGIGLMTENGKLKLNTAVSVNADISKILSNIDLGTGSSAGIMGQINSLAADISNVTNKLNEVAGEINGAIDQVNGLYTDALDFVTQFTNINFAMDFAIDECTKFGVGFQQGILNPEFIERARASNPLNNAANPGFGTGFR